MKMRGQSGFTIVELIVVIIVIGVLATITSMMYNSSQQQAADVKIRDAADKFADAIRLWSAQNGGAKPQGGYGSSTPANGSACTNGSTGFQDYGYAAVNGNYQCTIGDAMVATGYLTADLFNSLPGNTIFNGTKSVFMIYPCTNDATRWILLYTLQLPATGDTTNLNNIFTTCGIAPASSTSWVTTYGMRGGLYLKFS